MATPEPTIDLKRLAAEVSVLHGMRIDPDDPMVAVVTLNRLVFEHAVAQALERVQLVTREFDAAADKVQVRAGGVLAQEVRDCALAMRQEFAKAFEEFRRDGPENGSEKSDAYQRSAKWRWLVTGLALALALFGLGIWMGAALR